MSGTSLDGVDAAVVDTDGHRIFGFGATGYKPYSDLQRQVLRSALGCWPSDNVDEAAEVVETVHAQVLSAFEDVDLIGFHGQTLAHEPGARGTHQVGDGAVLAEVLGKPVAWDFRTTDVELGGQGAPLAPFFHHALARWLNLSEPVCFLNLGGVGNLTWVDPAIENPDDPGALIAFDTGPANAPINDYMRQHRGLDFDEGGALAAQGTPNEEILTRFLSHRYFYKMPPKSLDRDDFSTLASDVEKLPAQDAVATLTTAAALSVEAGLQHLTQSPSAVLVTGGGRHNTALMAMLSATLECTVRNIDEVGLDGDMLEAQAFAYLAVRVANGLPTSAPSTTGVKAAVCGGVISRPAS